ALGIPFYVFDFRDAFRRCVIADFADQYSAGRTPNPCIVCNRTMKFGLLMEKARQLGCDKLVTGHYARVAFDPETSLYTLKKGLDETKDQSYVLYHLSQKQLSHLLLPLGDLTKAQVRELAAEAGFVNADRPESQDICFVPDGDYAAVIRRYSGREFPPGEFVDLQGQVMGTHKGIIHYTIGQTRRLGQAFGVSRYVCAIDGEKNRITLGGPEDVFSLTAQAADCCWTAGRIPDAPVRCKIRLRYKQKEQWATVRPLPAENARDHAACCGQGSVPHRMDRPAGRTEIIFDEPQRAITPGQAAVFYDGDAVLGGGTIIQSASRPPGP
ncbi:MAG: tRNA 2-thiouridine(34) synthase MnmA, partial [Bacillota bacterium]|nr:tRNA 2-thiouridine(34) synthase MnmA [Bacillota bacterium]